jgi:peptide/nickel transport system permease protein
MKYFQLNRQRDYLAVVAWCIIFGFLSTAIFAGLIANDRPIFAKKGTNWTLPILDLTSRHSVDYSGYDRLVYPPIPFRHEGYTNLRARLKPPGTRIEVAGRTKVHRLGTDRLGRDVAAGLIYGCRKSIFIAFISIALSALVGILLGALSGFWGNRMPLVLTWYTILWCLSIPYLIFLSRYQILSGYLCLAVLLISAIPLYFLKWGRIRKVHFPIDNLVLKLIELFQSIPGLLILMVIAALIRQPSMLLLALIIALIRWTGFARHSRSEVLKIRSRDYITAAQVSGLSPWKIITRYILPEAFGPLVVIFAFGLASVILLESTLSFLGIGIPVDEVTWGTLLSQAKQYPTAWWLAVFPGLCILCLVFSINLVGDKLKRHFDVQD